MPSEICLQCPTSQEVWKKVAQEFADRWQFPNCIGAVAITPLQGLDHSSLTIKISTARFYLELQTPIMSYCTSVLDEMGVCPMVQFFKAQTSTGDSKVRV